MRNTYLEFITNTTIKNVPYFYIIYDVFVQESFDYNNSCLHFNEQIKGALHS